MLYSAIYSGKCRRVGLTDNCMNHHRLIRLHIERRPRPNTCMYTHVHKPIELYEYKFANTTKCMFEAIDHCYVWSYDHVHVYTDDHARCIWPCQYSKCCMNTNLQKQCTAQAKVVGHVHVYTDDHAMQDVSGHACKFRWLSVGTMHSLNSILSIAAQILTVIVFCAQFSNLFCY